LYVADTITEKEINRESNPADSSISEEHEPLKAYLSKKIGFEIASAIEWIQTDQRTEIPELSEGSAGLGNILRINDRPELNGYLTEVNVRLKKGQYTVLCMETKNTRKTRLLNRYPAVFSYPYYIADFAVTRVLAKLSPTRKLYRSVTGGKNRVMTLTEGLARLVCAGFQIIDYKKIDGLTYIIGRKTGEPDFESDPTYGAIVKLPRVGKNGEIVEVYKIRTMHPYSEYLQEYMFERFGTENGDKIENDFRKTRWGRVFRKYWIDELPMILNLLKRDLKLIGVRPLSKHKYDTYPEYLQKKRIQTKPGLIPPFYSELPETAEEFFEVEDRYLESYNEKPVRTDIRYFFKACFNIIFKGQRSR